jgi:hypothetical protein
MQRPSPRSPLSRRASAISGFWSVLGLMAVLCLGLTSESVAALTTSRESRTFYAVQGGANPPSQWFYVYKNGSTPATLTALDNASWVRVSPTKTTITNRVTLTVYVNTTGLGAGTYKANITIKAGTWGSKVIPVTLILSPSTTSPPPPSPPPATSTATLTWNAATGTISGYKIYVGEAPRLYTRTVTVGNITSSTVNSLTVGRMYYFAVTAYNSAGESAPSNEVSKTIQ